MCAGVQIRQAKGWPAAHYLRLVAAGRELWEDDRIAPGAVLHCVASDRAPPAGRRRPRRDEQPTADWVRSLARAQEPCRGAVKPYAPGGGGRAATSSPPRTGCAPLSARRNPAELQ